MIDKFEIAGAGTTVKLIPLLALPETVTTTLPLDEPAGTVTAMLVDVHEEELAVTPLNFTLLPVEDPKVVPVIVTLAPTAPVVIDRLDIWGVTVKLFPLLATPDTVTTTFPVVAADGTVATMLVEVHELVDAVVPLNLTLFPELVPKFVPVIVTDVPTGPEVTDKLVMLGPVAEAIEAKREDRTTNPNINLPHQFGPIFIPGSLLKIIFLSYFSADK